jgi:RNA polymerase sigma-70 factor, ECF subfamily
MDASNDPVVIRCVERPWPRSDVVRWWVYTFRSARSLELLMSKLADTEDGLVLRRPVGDTVLTFEEFFHAEQARLFQALVVITRSRSEAEDIAQEAFLRVWERWDRIRSLQDPAGYLHRTAMNAFRDRYRRASLSLTRAFRPPAGTDAFDQVEARSVADQILGSLTPRQRAVVVLTEGLGYSADEAGDLLGIKGSTVRALHHQARTALSKAAETDDE